MMERPALITDPDPTLEKFWDWNLSQATPYEISLAVDGLIVSGIPVGPANYNQRLIESQAALSERRGDIDQVQERRRTAGEQAASLEERIAAAPGHGKRVIPSDYFHLADVEVYGAGNDALMFSVWRCPKHRVTGWAFGRPGQV